MIKDEIKKALNPLLEDGDIPLGVIDEDAFIIGLIKPIFEKNHINFATSLDDMVDSCGFDCWAYTIAWQEEGETKILVYRVVSY